MVTVRKLAVPKRGGGITSAQHHQLLLSTLDSQQFLHINLEMATQSDEDGMKIVRRFTDDLEGNTELERNTQAAQADLDEKIKASNDSRLKKLYNDSNGSPS
jgi:hypothetical protein